MLCDMVISSALGVEDVAYWSKVRALNGLLAIACLLGLEQFLARFPERASDVKRLLVVQIPLMALVSAGVVAATDFLRPWFVAASIGVFSAVSISMFQFYRGRNMFILAQICQQSWKGIFLVGVVLYAVIPHDLSFSSVVEICALVSLAALALLNLLARGGADLPARQNAVLFSGGTRDVYGISFRLMAISSFTALSLYAEQVLVNAVGSDFAAAKYFTHTIYFLFTSSLVTGYLAFIGVPWAIRNEARFMRIFHEQKWQAIGLCVVFVLLFQLLAYGLWYALTPKVGNVDFVLLSLFSISSISRLVYTYPASYFGAFGDKLSYNDLILRQIGSLGLAVLLFLGLFLLLDLPSIYAVALASAGNWVVRTGLGLQLIGTASRQVAA